MDLDIQTLGGNCPVQGDGTVDSHRWYFRARGEAWSFEVWAEGIGIPVDDGNLGWDLPMEEPVFDIGAPYNPEDEFGAGYMPEEDARRFIEESAQKFAEFKAAGGLAMWTSPSARRLRKRRRSERRRRALDFGNVIATWRRQDKERADGQV